MDLKETVLPSIGIKYTFTSKNGVFNVISKLDGTKELYYQDKNGVQTVISMDARESKKLGMILLDLIFDINKNNENIFVYEIKNKENAVNPEFSRVSMIAIIRNGKYIQDDLESLELELNDIVLVRS